MSLYRSGCATAIGLLLLAGVGTANAEARHGWYVSLEGGASSVSDTEVSGTPNSYDFEWGWVGLGAVGHRFEDSWRVEIEGGIRRNNIGALNGVNSEVGHLKEVTGFVNVLYDAIGSSRWGFAAGGGLGFDNARFTDHAGAESTDTVFAAQGIAGLTYQIGDHFEMAFSYRYLWTLDEPVLDTTVGIIVSSGEMDLSKHAFTLGLRYGFDGPPPPAAPQPVAPPPPPPPPPAVKQFIVFFGFNKSNLTAEAQAVVAEAAAAAKTQGTASIAIVGHTDTAGSNDYNDQLSHRRATAVKDELMRLGVSSDSISASGKGESELMVQTGDGVKEPQNRRATIDLK